MKIIFEKYQWLLERTQANDTSAQALCNKLIPLIAMNHEGILGDNDLLEVLNEVLEHK